jgi:hypothetical protein
MVVARGVIVVTADGGGGGLDSVAPGVVVGCAVVVALGGVGGGLEVVVGGVVVVTGGGGELDIVARGVTACGVGGVTAAASEEAPVTISRPPLPLIPGGTGPGAEGVGTTPVRYAWAHRSTMST